MFIILGTRVVTTVSGSSHSETEQKSKSGSRCSCLIHYINLTWQYVVCTYGCHYGVGGGGGANTAELVCTTWLVGCQVSATREEVFTLSK